MLAKGPAWTLQDWYCDVEQSEGLIAFRLQAVLATANYRSAVVTVFPFFVKAMMIYPRLFVML